MVGEKDAKAEVTPVLQEYVVAPEAVNVEDEPGHAKAKFGVTAIVGDGLTVMDWVAEFLQPVSVFVPTTI